MMITSFEQNLLSAPLKCVREGCLGTFPDLSIRTLRALIEHNLRRDPSYQYSEQCSVCATKSHYAYSDVINLIPGYLRPKSLPKGQFWGLMLLPMPESQNGDVYYMGDRVLLEHTGELDGYWLARLLTLSSLAPKLAKGTIIQGCRYGEFQACQAIYDGSATQSLFLEMPPSRTADTGIFVEKSTNPGILLSTQPFCSNPSCCHIVGLYYTQFLKIVEAQRDVKWFYGTNEGYLLIDCQRCGTSTVITGSSYDELFKI